MKRLILHVGTHKTGTTSIQYTLSRSEAVLAQQGAIYPKHYAKPKNPGHHFLAQGPSTKRYKALIEDIDRSPLDTVILSTEMLSVVSPEVVSDLAGRYDTTVVCLLRRQDDYLESMYRQLCKSSFCELSPDTFVDTVLKGDPLLVFSNFKNRDLRAPLPADYEKLLAAYSELLGPNRVIGIPYDDPAFGADAVEKFCRSIGLQADAIDGGPRNVGFSPEVVELRRSLDQHLDTDEKVALRPAFWTLNNAVASDQKGQSILGTEQRRLILNHYASSNAELRKRFIPQAGVDWLVCPEKAAQTVVAQQAEPLSKARAIDLTARLMTATGMLKRPKPSAK